MYSMRQCANRIMRRRGKREGALDYLGAPAPLGGEAQVQEGASLASLASRAVSRYANRSLLGSPADA
jgi:hypothetical protein